MREVRKSESKLKLQNSFIIEKLFQVTASETAFFLVDQYCGHIL
jgi:hypothetical protein